MKNEPVNTQLAALREVVALSPDASLIIDCEERKVVCANAAVTSLAGIRTGDPLDKFEALIDIVIIADREYVRNKYLQICHRPTTLDIEFRMTGSAGAAIWINCSTYLIDHDRYVYVVARDATRPRQHEEYLVEYGAKKNTLLDTVGHQLSGALALMNNLALKAERSLDESDDRAIQTFITLVHNNTNHCINIINNLMLEEHTESPGIFVKFNRADAVKIVTYIFEELKKNETGRNLVFETAAPLMLVTTDEVKLLQIVNNLTSNAVKFTLQGGEIRIAMRETPEVVLITVSDTGIGIPEQLKPYVFEKYGPARRTGLNGEKSTGLGLSICKLLTELIGGRMWFESEEGKGSTFYLEVPKE